MRNDRPRQKRGHARQEGCVDEGCFTHRNALRQADSTEKMWGKFGLFPPQRTIQPTIAGQSAHERERDVRG